jgi:hypothetical protein
MSINTDTAMQERKKNDFLNGILYPITISYKIKRCKRYLDDSHVGPNIKHNSIVFNHNEETITIKENYPQIENIVTKTKEYAIMEGLSFNCEAYKDVIIKFNNCSKIPIIKRTHVNCKRNKCNSHRELGNHIIKYIPNFKQLVKDIQSNSGWNVTFRLLYNLNMNEETRHLELFFVCIGIEFQDSYAQCK